MQSTAFSANTCHRLATPKQQQQQQHRLSLTRLGLDSRSFTKELPRIESAVGVDFRSDRLHAAAASPTAAAAAAAADRPPKQTDLRSCAVALAKVADDTKALDISVLHVEPVVSWTSYMVLCTGGAHVHVFGDSISQGGGPCQLLHGWYTGTDFIVGSCGRLVCMQPNAYVPTGFSVVVLLFITILLLIIRPGRVLMFPMVLAHTINISSSQECCWGMLVQSHVF